MRATKLKKGYRLNLSDSEMNVLRLAVRHLQADWAEEGDYSHIAPAQKAAFHRSFMSLNWPEHIENRRD